MYFSFNIFCVTFITMKPSASDSPMRLLLRKHVTNAHVDTSWIHSRDERHVMWGWPPRPYSAEKQWSEKRWWRQCAQCLRFLFCWLSIWSQPSPVMWTWFLTGLSVIQIRGRWKEEGRREGGRQRESEARGMIKGGAALGDSPTNRQIYWKCKEGRASLKSHGTLRPITGQWLYGQLCIMKMRPKQIWSYHRVGKV